MARKRDPEGQALVDQVMYPLFGPFIGFPGWEDLLRRHKEQIILQRFAHHQEIFEAQQCTEFEAMLYVSTASLAHPIGHDFAQIYLWLFSRWQPEVAKAQDLVPDRPELNVNQQEDLVRLRRWIFKQQMDHIRRKTRGEPTAPPAAPEPELVQLSFFQENET